MTGDNIKELFYEIVDDEEISDDSLYIMMNNQEDKLEDERDWVILRKKDTSITHTSSDTYQTGHSLPSRFKRERSVFVQFPSGNIKELLPISYDDIDSEKDSYDNYAINYSENKIYLTGVYTESVTVILNYIQASEEIDEDTVLVWPRQRGAILAWMMAKAYSSGMDGDEVNFRMSEEQMNEFNELKAGMIQWDAALQLKQMGGQAGFNPRVK